jgi:hypothetical protein
MTVGGVAALLLADGDLWLLSSSSETLERFFLLAPNGGDCSASEKPESC